MIPLVYSTRYAPTVKRAGVRRLSKYAHIRTGLSTHRLLDERMIFAPVPFGASQIELAHDRSYVNRVLANRLTNAEWRRIGLPNDPLLIDRVRRTCAGTTLAASLALESMIAINLAGGSHHADHASGSGFCIFNDVAVAIANLRAQGFRGNVLVVDLDVHQGDGTARMFQQDESVFTMSVHCEANFPQEKARSDLDLGLRKGTEDSAYLDALSFGLGVALSSAKPKLAFYNAGVDVHRDDRLGLLRLSDDGLRSRERMVLQRLRSHSVPVACVLGGGYAELTSDVARRHLLLFEEALAAGSGEG